MRVIYEHENYRIIEVADETGQNIDDLAGDTFRPECHPDIPESQILQEKAEFEDLVNRKGVYGYVLEYWNSDVGQGWQHIDSCYGFVGQYSESDKANWQLETIGYTWLRADGCVGLGRMPAKTRREAEKIMREINQNYQERMRIWNAARAK